MLLLITAFVLETALGSLGFSMMGGGMKDTTGMDGTSWEAKFHNADGQVCQFKNVDYKFMGLGALNCGWNGKDSRFQRKFWSDSGPSKCSRECRKLQWCNYAWSDSGATKLFNKGAGWCYLYHTCDERTGTEEGRLMQKHCPKTPEIPCKESCNRYAYQWAIDGDCDAGNCLGCDKYWKGDKFDNNACGSDGKGYLYPGTASKKALAMAEVTPESGNWVVYGLALFGFGVTAYGAFAHFSKKEAETHCEI